MTDRPPSCRPITWADLTSSSAAAPRRPTNTYQLTGCPKCARQRADGVVARRLPTRVSAADDSSAEAGTYHRNVADARAGTGPLCNCPKCGAPINPPNRPN